MPATSTSASRAAPPFRPPARPPRAPSRPLPVGGLGARSPSSSPPPLRDSPPPRHADLPRPQHAPPGRASAPSPCAAWWCVLRSEEHTSELQSRPHLVCRLLLEKKKNIRSQSPAVELEPSR